MNMKQFIKKNPVTQKWYLKMKKLKEAYEKKERTSFHGKFIDRKKIERKCVWYWLDIRNFHIRLFWED